MGWSYGINADGREVGYSVDAECDKDGCNAQINRGLGYCCGGMHDGGEHGCGGYFCSAHLCLTENRDGASSRAFLCEMCADEFESIGSRT